MKRAVWAAAIIALLWPAIAVAEVDTVCSKGGAQFQTDLQAYYGCIQQAAEEMEPSREAADTVAEGAVAACNIMAINVHMEASTCDGNAAIRSGLAVIPRGLENSIANLEGNGHGLAVVTVLRIRAARNTAPIPTH